MRKKFARDKFLGPTNQGKIRFTWLDVWPTRETSKVFIEIGYDKPFVYIGIGRFVMAWDRRPTWNWARRKKVYQEPAKVLEFKNGSIRSSK